MFAAHNDLLFCEPALPYVHVRSPTGRTLPKTGGVFGAQGHMLLPWARRSIDLALLLANGAVGVQSRCIEALREPESRSRSRWPETRAFLLNTLQCELPDFSAGGAALSGLDIRRYTKE